MKEGQFTNKLLKALRSQMPPNAVIWKWSDSWNAGRPDVSITGPSLTTMSLHDRRTLWLEIKIIPGGRLFKPLQQEELRRVNGWYVFWLTEKKRGYLFRAAESEGWENGQALTFAELVGRIAGMF